MESVGDGRFGNKSGPCSSLLLVGRKCKIPDTGVGGSAVVSAGLIDVSPPVDGGPCRNSGVIWKALLASAVLDGSYG